MVVVVVVVDDKQKAPGTDGQDKQKIHTDVDVRLATLKSSGVVAHQSTSSGAPSILDGVGGARGPGGSTRSAQESLCESRHDERNARKDKSRTRKREGSGEVKEIDRMEMDKAQPRWRLGLRCRRLQNYSRGQRHEGVFAVFAPGRDLLRTHVLVFVLVLVQ